MGQICFKTFGEGEFKTIVTRPDSARKDPYRLFVSYFWNLLKSELYDMEYEESDPEYDEILGYDEFSIDGMDVPKSIMEPMLKSAAEDFRSAIDNGLAIRIQNKPYRIPGNVSMTAEELATNIFRFPESTKDHLCVTVSWKYVYDVVETDRSNIDIKKDSRIYMHKIAWLVENTDDGWDELTDIEAAVYIWMLRMHKHEGELVKDIPLYVYDVLSEIEETIGYNLKEFKPNGEITPDAQIEADYIRSWNYQRCQESVIDKVDTEKSEEYWYETKNK